MTAEAEQDAALAVAESLATRLCHDFAGPLGTIEGMLALGVGADDAASEEAAELARLSSVQLSAQIRLIRAAWGGGCGPQGRDELRRLADGLPGRERIQLCFDGPDDPAQEDEARLMLCLLLVAAGAARRGSVISVSRSAGKAAIGLGGAHPGWPDGFLACLGDAHAAEARLLRPREAAAGFAALFAARAGWRCKISGPDLLATRDGLAARHNLLAEARS